jgi:hypothetical protein
MNLASSIESAGSLSATHVKVLFSELVQRAAMSEFICQVNVLFAGSLSATYV